MKGCRRYSDGQAASNFNMALSEASLCWMSLLTIHKPLQGTWEFNIRQLQGQSCAQPTLVIERSWEQIIGVKIVVFISSWNFTLTPRIVVNVLANEPKELTLYKYEHTFTFM